jgi:hypothetical protein
MALPAKMQTPNDLYFMWKVYKYMNEKRSGNYTCFAWSRPQAGVYQLTAAFVLSRNTTRCYLV